MLVGALTNKELVQCVCPVGQFEEFARSAGACNQNEFADGGACCLVGLNHLRCDHLRTQQAFQSFATLAPLSVSPSEVHQ